VVAVRDLSTKRVIQPGPLESRGVLTADRMYVSGCPSVAAMGEVLQAAGLSLQHMAFVNPYLTSKMPAGQMNQEYAKHFEFGNTPARATIQVAALPGGAPVVFTGVAARDLAQRRAVRPKNMAPSPTASPCVFIGETLFCSAKSGFIPGPQSGIYASTVETQLRQTMRNLLDGLEEAGMSFENVVATNVYLDDIGEFAQMNKVYAQYFTKMPPTRTTIQQVPSVERKASANDRWPTLEQISLIAVK
jgi:enamine deaminase RidA (YjgF/YER057c/UK114 family)